MSRKGGYAVLDLSGVSFTIDSPGMSDTNTIRNASSIAHQLDKPLMVSGLTVNGDAVHATFPVMSGSSWVIDIGGGYHYTISVGATNNVVTVSVDADE